MGRHALGRGLGLPNGPRERRLAPKNGTGHKGNGVARKTAI
jgi:hypothetical protein